MKPGSSFKLSKMSKRVLSFILDSHKRGAIKRSLIEAQMQYEIKPKASKEDKSKESD